MADCSEVNARYKELFDKLSLFLNTGKAQTLAEKGADKELLPYIQAVNKFFSDYAEMSAFLKRLSAGELMTDPPSRKNLMAGPLKNLHAQLLHITWQAQQVSNGDYNQSVDFMGEFADAFNKMTEQLSERERRIKQNFGMFIKVLESMPDIVIVVDNDGELLFKNPAADKFIEDLQGYNCPYPECTEDRCMFNFPCDGSRTEKELFCPAARRYYDMNVGYIEWTDTRDAFLLTLRDITSARLMENELRSAAYLDAATGVGNRNGAIDHLSRLQAEGVPFALVFVDFDKLKRINDRYGHSEGDNALQTLAEYLCSSLREKDRVFRIGGDEFIVVMRGCSEDAARRAMLRIRERIVDFNKGRPYALCFSFGVYEYDADSGLSVEETLSIADSLMYKDKRRRKTQRVG